MKVGINFSGKDLNTILKLIKLNEISFIEILIDNFLYIDAVEILNLFGNIPYAFHIMNSQYLTRDIDELKFIAKQIKKKINVLNPIYISDHLGWFVRQGRNLSLVQEVNYLTDFDFVVERLSIWQEELNHPIYIENFPSTSHIGKGQVNFFEKLLNTVGCHVLFDFSNAVISQLNGGNSISEWSEIIDMTNHWHIAGYRKTGFEDSTNIYQDTHDCSPSEISLNFLAFYKKKRSCSDKITISVERDFSISLSSWRKDLELVRKAINTNEY